MANGLSFIGPPEAPVTGTTQGSPIDRDAALIEKLLSNLDLGQAPVRPKTGGVRGFFGSLGDALSAAAAVRAGGAPPPIGAFAANRLRQQQRFQQESAETAAANRALGNRIRIGRFEAEQRHGFRLKEIRARERTERARDLFFRGDPQWVVDEAGNRFFEVAIQDRASGDFVMKLIPAASTARLGITEPSGSLRIASQPLTPIGLPEGTALLDRTVGKLKTEKLGVPITPSEEGEPLPPAAVPQPKIIGTPISSDQNVEAIQAEMTLLTIAESALATIEKLSGKPEVFGERTLKRFLLTTPGVAGIGGREGVTRLDPDFSEFVSELKRLQSAFEEEQRGNRLTTVRLSELGGFIPRGDESFGDMRTKIRNLIGDVRRRIAVRAELQPGITSRLPKSQGNKVPDSEFKTLREKRQSGNPMTEDEMKRLLIGGNSTSRGRPGRHRHPNQPWRRSSRI